MRNKRGFTLVELLAVIVILAFMVAILLPALRSAQRKGYAMACASNMRQIGIAIANYCTDHNGYYPHVPMCNSLAIPPSTFAWWSVLAEKGYLSKEASYPSLENEDSVPGFADSQVYPTRIFLCRSQSEKDTHPTHGSQLGFKIATAYGMNIFFDSWIVGDANARKQTAYWAMANRGYSQDNPTSFVDNVYPSLEGDIKTEGVTLRDGSKIYLPVRETTVQQPSEKFLIADTLYRRPGTYYRNKQGAFWHNVFWRYTPFFGHPGRRCNVLFADYHVGSIRANDEGVLSNGLAGPGDGISASRINESEDSEDRPSVPAALSTNARFFHWAPFAARMDWDNWPPQF